VPIGQLVALDPVNMQADHDAVVRLCAATVNSER
jgi:hypothetical protein